MEEKVYISVILPLKLDWDPYYSLPKGAEVSPGTRVRVRFANKEYIGAVCATGITPNVPLPRIQPVISIEDGLAAILPEEIALWKQVAEYYLCTVGEVYKAAYPQIKTGQEEAEAAARQKAAAKKERVAESIRARLRRLDERLARKVEQEGKAKAGTKMKLSLAEDIRKIKEDRRLAEEALTAAMQSIEDAGNGTYSMGPLQEDKVILSPAQTKVCKDIKEAIKSMKPVLLHGATGSGKTEIYIKLAYEAMQKGQNVLYLVPEIALSRQLEDRLYEHFGDRLLTYHSAETAASRRHTAETIRNTEGHLLLGTRSALFLPLHDLGLIIVDEEHDSSYKQDSPAPRYNGRDTALMLHRIHRCGIVLGSATPSLEELYNCATGKHVRTVLNERYHGSSEAETEIIDTKAERRKNGMAGSFSRKLIDHIRTTLAEGGQVLILRSRRSWAPVLQCQECGELVRCPHCNVTLNLHKSPSAKMVCHYCGHSEPYTGTCARCSGQLTGLGTGTQKIEEEAAALFPDARIARLDSDSKQDKVYENKVIKEFGKGDIDILIGTQIITKGFDFGNLTLVAVIAADSLLGMMDFRADEKAMHILEQFKGRCGRRSEKGHIVIQTAQPEHPVYQRLAEHSGESYDAMLMQERKDFGFPPYSRIIELTIKDMHEHRADCMSRILSDILKSGFTADGPYSPAVDKVAGQHIRKIRIMLKKDKTLKDGKSRLADTIRRFEKEKKYEGHIIIDVDPS